MNEVLRAIIEESATNPRVQKAIDDAAGRPVFVESKSGAQALDLTALLAALPTLIPLLITLFTGGGFSPALIAVLIPIIAQLFGVKLSQEQIEKLESAAQQGGAV